MILNNLDNKSNELVLENIRILFSYQTPVCARFNGRCLITNVYYSRATTKHISNYTAGISTEYVSQHILDNILSIYKYI